MSLDFSLEREVWHSYDKGKTWVKGGFQIVSIKLTFAEWIDRNRIVIL